MNVVRPGWERVALADCGVLLTGGTPSRSEPRFWGGTIPRISAKSLKNFDVVDSDERVTEAGAATGTIVPPGSVLFVVGGMSLAKEFRVGVVAGSVTFNQDLRALVPREGVDGGYLARFLEAAEGRILTLVDEASHGTKRLSSGRFESIEVPLPPVAEQRLIAEILDKADALRAKRRAALALLDTLTQSIFLEMFGHPAINPKGWPRVKLGALVENQDSLRVPVKSSDRDGKKGAYAYYGASGIIDWVDEYIFDGERLLVAEDGANLVSRVTPIAFIAQGKYWVNNHAHVLAENGRARLHFLEFFLERSDLQPFLSGTAQPKLNQSNLDRIPVPLPPRDLQDEFSRRAQGIAELRATQSNSLVELDALFASLQHRAFRGEL